MEIGQHIIAGLGEVLWDYLPQGRQLGGAPANFAYIAARLGEKGVIASRVGADTDGDEMLALLAERGLDTTCIQRDTERGTGRVIVKTDAAGQASYAIEENVAWDYLDWTPELENLSQRAAAVCFGTLAQRSEVSRAAIRRFLAVAPPATLRVFDVNLRQSFFDAALLRESLGLCNACKLNHEELPRLAEMLGTGGTGLEEQAIRLRQVFGLRFLCVTRGASGSFLVTEEQNDAHSGYQVRVVDTVGAGDAFTAGLVCAWLRGEPLPRVNAFANRVGAWVASQTGAMPSRAFAREMQETC